ncbi:MAG: MBL fold metallo-hydrolase [Sphaerochaetaceae bacterium]
MRIEKLVTGPYQTNCYLLFKGEMAWVIDPADEAKRILERLNNLKGVILTHFHYDHLLALPQLIKAFPTADIFMHPLDSPYLGPLGGEALGAFARSIDPAFSHLDVSFWRSLPAATVLVEEGDVIPEIGLEVMHTPGHSLGSICLYKEGSLFAGDTLFANSIGRTDLIHSDPALIVNSIKTKLLTLPKATVVYPGHGPETTIGKELANNPFL